VLKAIYEKLSTHSLELQQCGDSYFVEIDQKIDGLALSSNDGTQRTSLFRCLLSPLALAALHQVFKAQAKEPTASPNSRTLRDSMNVLITHFGGREYPRVKLFCDTCAEFAMTTLHPELPLFLKEYARGATPSHAMPLISLNMHFNRSTHEHRVVSPLPSVSRLPHAAISVEKKQFMGPADSLREHGDSLEYWDNNLTLWLTINRNNSQQAEILSLIKRLREHTDNSANMPYSVHILLQWFIDSLEACQWKHAETPKKYFRTVGRDWLKWTLAEDLINIDGAEMDFLCQAITQNDNEKEEKRRRLRDLIQFGVKCGNLTAPDDPFYSTTDSNKYVRSLVIPPHITLQVGHDLQQSLREKCQHTQRTLTALYCVLSRLMLRPTEIVRLRIKDIELSKEGVLFVRPHKGEQLKNLNSKRQVPYGILMLENERETFETYVKLRAQQAQGSLQEYLFSKSAFGNKPYTTKEIEAIITPLISKYFGFPVPIYQFRHTGITSVTCLMFGSEALVQQLTPYSQYQASAIKQELAGERHRDKLWAIAMTAGHQTPQTTLFSYIHCCELLIADYVLRSSQTYPDTFWFNLAGLPGRQIKQLKKLTVKCQSQTKTTEMNEQCIPTKQVLPALNKKIRKYAIKNSVKDTRKYTNESVSNTPVRPTLNQCYKVLKQSDMGMSFAEIALASPIDEEVITSWIDAAKQVAYQYVTSQKKPRLITKEGQLCPSHHKADADEIDTLVTVFKEIYKDNKIEVLWCIDYLLNHVISSKPYVSFKCPREFERFMRTCLKIAPAKRWRLELKMKGENQHKLPQWQTIKGLNVIVDTIPANNVETTKLYFQRKNNELGLNYKAKSSRNIRFLFHMVKIMLVAKDKLASTNNHAE
tara:strand:+ start:19922 stop:22540 length:2619 start_codon:yes stop_codon:yes gene_type:complete